MNAKLSLLVEIAENEKYLSMEILFTVLLNHV